MRKLLIFAFFILAALMSGCASSPYGEMLSAYNPQYIGAKASDKELAFIKTTNGMIIVSVDGVRYVNFMKVMVGKGLDSIKVKEGKHSMMGVYKNVRIDIGYVLYKANHEYLIDYFDRGDKVIYWVKDLTDNKVIYGKEITPEVRSMDRWGHGSMGSWIDGVRLD